MRIGCSHLEVGPLHRKYRAERIFDQPGSDAVMSARYKTISAIVIVGLSFLLLSFTAQRNSSGPADRQGTEAVLFDPDPNDISNRLYREVHVRTSADGTEFGLDSLDPLLWLQTKYLLTGKSHAKTLKLLDEFLRTRAERQTTDPLKRAILQRDLWAVFDWADARAGLHDSHQADRRKLMAKLAPAIRSLALTPEEIAALPDSFELAIQKKEFPASYDSAEPNRAFLPPDLFDPHGPWVCLGAPGDQLAAPLHDSSFNGRSVFLVFAHLPGGREATVAYFKQLAEVDTPLFVKMQTPGLPQPMNMWNPQVPQFPAGTEFALVRRMVLPDKDGHLHLTPIIENIQIRHYTAVPIVSPQASRDTNLARRFQSPSEIKLSRALLFSGRSSGLRGVTASDDPFLIFPAMSQGDDAFEEGSMRVRAFSPFVQCTGCHHGPGLQSMMSFSFRANPNYETVRSPRLAETTPHGESEKVLESMLRQENWKDLLRLWASANGN